MSAAWAIVIGVLAAFAATCFGDLVSEEIRGRLDLIPRALIRLAARRVPQDMRDDLRDDWLAELEEFLHGNEVLPITRLIHGTRFALGLVRTAPGIARDLSAKEPVNDSPIITNALNTPSLTTPGLIDIPWSLNLVAAPDLALNMASWRVRNPHAPMPDLHDVIDIVMADLRSMSADEGVPATIKGCRNFPQGLRLYTSDYVLWAHQTNFGDGYAIRAIHPIRSRDRDHLARGILRLRPMTWSFYYEICYLPHGPSACWNLVIEEWTRLHPDTLMRDRGRPEQ